MTSHIFFSSRFLLLVFLVFMMYFCWPTRERERGACWNQGANINTCQLNATALIFTFINLKHCRVISGSLPHSGRLLFARSDLRNEMEKSIFISSNWGAIAAVILCSLYQFNYHTCTQGHRATRTFTLAHALTRTQFISSIWYASINEPIE